MKLINNNIDANGLLYMQRYLLVKRPGMPICYNILKKNLFVSLQALSKKLRISSSPGCSPAVGGDAEIIPVEPDQGNACAGKVVPSFAYASLPQHFSQTIFSKKGNHMK